MSEFVSRVNVDINGQTITDFKNFKVGEREHRKQVDLMHKTGHINVTPRHTFSLDYVTPSTDSEFDFESLNGDARVSIEKPNGSRITFTGVSSLKEGEETFDGENEATRTIEFGATGRVIE